MKYGTLIDNQFYPAPRAFMLHGAMVTNPKAEHFAALADANVTAPVYHAEQREFSGQTFAGYYTVTETIPNPASATTYFLWIKCEADAPSGDGATLDLPNDRLGGAGGFDFGDLTITVGGRTPFTGFVTNDVTHEVLYFDQGFYKGNPEEGL